MLVGYLRLRYFDIKYINYKTTVDEVVAAFNTENDGPGQLPGYRAMHKQLREQHGVYDVMTMECPEGLGRRKNVGKKKRKTGPVGTFTSLVSMGKKNNLPANNPFGNFLVYNSCNNWKFIVIFIIFIICLLYLSDQSVYKIENVTSDRCELNRGQLTLKMT